MKKSKWAALAIGIVVVASALTAASHAPSNEGDRATRWGDKEIVEGVALGVGPVASRLGLSQAPASGVSARALLEGQRVEKQVLAEMLSKHPSEIHAAVGLLTSGDPYKVPEGQSQLAKTFQKRLSATHPEFVDSAGMDSRCGIIAACAVVAVLGAALGVAVVIVAEAAVVGHAAVYAKQALWDRSSATGGLDASSIDVPSFTAAEFTASLTAELAR